MRGTTWRRIAQDGSAGVIHNQGTIEAAPGGFVVMFGDAVLNEGAIVAELGSIGTATVHEAIGRRGYMGVDLSPIQTGASEAAPSPCSPILVTTR